jgi:hypothetical protein
MSVLIQVKPSQEMSEIPDKFQMGILQTSTPNTTSILFAYNSIQKKTIHDVL